MKSSLALTLRAIKRRTLAEFHGFDGAAAPRAGFPLPAIDFERNPEIPRFVCMKSWFGQIGRVMASGKHNLS
jgi:hypothetical protein